MTVLTFANELNSVVWPIASTFSAHYYARIVKMTFIETSSKGVRCSEPNYLCQLISLSVFMEHIQLRLMEDQFQVCK
jgi:hypothetical protein